MGRLPQAQHRCTQRAVLSHHLPDLEALALTLASMAARRNVGRRRRLQTGPFRFGFSLRLALNAIHVDDYFLKDRPAMVQQRYVIHVASCWQLLARKRDPVAQD